MVKNTTNDDLRQNLPDWSYDTTHRCNLSPDLFGGLDFQFNPSPVYIKGVQTTYRGLFEQLDKCRDADERCDIFMSYMDQHYSKKSEYEDTKARSLKHKAGYLKLLRGWFFDTDGREGALIKGWVESRFGFKTLYHKGPLGTPDGADVIFYEESRHKKARATQMMEEQLDLLYSFGQYQLRREKIYKEVLPLYRGINGLDDFPGATRTGKRTAVLLLNNMNSFSSDRETAGQFGDIILEIAIPKEKIFAYPKLLPHRFESEHEFMVMGGLYKAQLSFM